jgi:lysophospholipase L1-like esterase
MARGLISAVIILACAVFALGVGAAPAFAGNDANVAIGYTNGRLNNATATGTATGAPLSDWLLQGQRYRATPLNLQAFGVMSGPPTITYSKANGLFSATIAAAGSGYAVNDTITLNTTGGACSTAPIVQVTGVSGGGVTSVSVVRGGICTSNPTNPLTQASSSGAGTGAQLTGTFASFAVSSVSNKVNYSPTGSTWRWNTVGALTNINSSGYYGTSGANGYGGTQASVEFWSDAPQIDLEILAFNTHFDVIVDGHLVQATDFATDASGAGYVLTFAWGSSAIHNYRIVGVNLGFGGAIVGSTYSIWAPNEPRQPVACVLGDSYTFGTNADSVVKSWAWTMGQAAGLEIVADGIGGTGWNSTAGNLPTTRITADLAQRTLTCNLVIFALGFNDSAGSMSTLTTNATAAIAQARASFPSAKLLMVGPWTPLGATANLTTVKTNLQAVASAAGVPYIDIENWVNANNKAIYTSGDNTHPTQAGYEFLGGRIGQAVVRALIGS